MTLSSLSAYSQVNTISDFFLKFNEKSINDKLFQSLHEDEIAYPSSEIRERLLAEKEIVISDLEQYKLIIHDTKNAYIKIEYSNAAINVIYTYTFFKNSKGGKIFAVGVEPSNAVMNCEPFTLFYEYKNSWIDCTSKVLANLKIEKFFAAAEVSKGKQAAGSDAKFKIELPRTGTSIKARIWPIKEEQLTSYSRFKALKVKPGIITMKWDKNSSMFIF
jgi:hypothetical protein